MLSFLIFNFFSDVKDIKCVINHEFPQTIEDYIHRIGRTGRQDKKGVAYTFYSVYDNSSLADDLVKVLRESNQEIHPKLLELANRYANNSRSNGFCLSLVSALLI